ncbi:UNVERIFIED_CONTAM: hypothetical protein Sindi_1657300 [Sesamum indicum]
MIEKSAPSVLVREASTSEAKGKGTRCWRRKKCKTESAIASAQSALVAQLGIGKGKRKVVKRSRRLRQTVLKLSNDRAVVTVVKGLNNLSY